MKNKLMFLVLVLTMVAVGYPVFAAVKIIKLNTQGPLIIGKTKSIKAKITTLSEKAVMKGYDEVQVKGVVSYQHLPNKQTRVTIKWGMLEKNKGMGEISAPINSLLMSRFMTDDKRIHPGTELNAKGDLVGLSRSLKQIILKKNAISKKVNNANYYSGDTTTQPQIQEIPVKKNKQNNISNLSNPSTGAGVVSTGDSSGTTPPSSTAKTGASLKLTTWQACSPRIDNTARMVYEQAREIVTLDTGTELSRSACQDHGATAPFKKIYGDCGTMDDIAGGFVYDKYREVAVLNGKSINVSSCQPDSLKKHPVLSTYEGCPIWHDFTNNVSVQKEQFYYMDEKNNRVDLGTCVNSKKTYKQYLTAATCSPTIDNTKGLVFIQKRVAYKLDNGTVAYASKCAPTSSAGTKILTKFCAQKYEHDFVAGTSYYRKYSYYMDGTTPITISACQRDTSLSFPHIQDKTNCPITNDDQNLRTIWQAQTFIDTPDDGRLEIAACQKTASPTSYAFTGNVTETPYNHTVTSPWLYVLNDKPLSKLYTPTLGWGVTRASYTGPQLQYLGNKSGLVPASNYDPRYRAFNNMCDPNTNEVTVLKTITETNVYRTYLRGDGTTYKLLDSSVVSFTHGCW